MRSLPFLALATLLAPASSLLEEKFVAFEPKNGSLDISNVQILYSWDDFVGVRIAAESLANDYAEITGSKPEARNVSRAELNAGLRGGNGTAAGTAIIVGSLKSSLIGRIAGNGTGSGATTKLDVKALEGKWETFKTAVVSNPLPGVRNALVITGSDKRGAIYGIHTLAEQCGQSPYVLETESGWSLADLYSSYHWFADVPAKKHDKIYALAKETVHGEPSVKYRGLFINDEEPATTM